ncbi:tautomerase family protein [Pseudomonas sp. RP23018S]|uniref:tautomerase family protein n=1 Tax=Pseudomonas sp. RP23018S TaxID=3096037 RepID=UPI002ACAA544|nr:tautomerase family protein [Pseudomonas sp. RP23018S]MDZ5603145.1 tautomerase family protein [Pseudomonas sp. RP23018S]
MPIVRIEDGVQRHAEQKHAVIETVYACLREVFGVSDEELQARYHCLAPQDWRTPGDRAQYLHVQITVFAGRTLATKRRLYQQVSERLAALLKIPADAVLVLLDEHPAQNWGMRGGVAACDIDFGYDVEV